MKKAIKIILLIIVLIIALLFAAPVLFKGKIITVANEQLKENLNADASFEDLSISFFRNFPYLGVRLKNLTVIGLDDFKEDTLLDVKAVDISVDLLSAIRMENIEVKRILIDEPLINAIILEDGKANWDIAPVSDTLEIEEEEEAGEIDTHVDLKLFRIHKAGISYTDYSSDMRASLYNFNFSLSGDLGADRSALILDSETEKLNFSMDGIRYLKNVLLKLHFDVDANLKEGVYTLNENRVSLNELMLLFEGNLSIPESGDILTELKFETGNTDFKTLLSLVPAIYLTDFEDLKTTGSLKLEGRVTGGITEETTPNVDLELMVNNATFSYPDLPESAKDINIDVEVHYDGVQNDNTTVDVNKFHLNMGGNPLDLELNLRTPISDPFTNGKLKTKLDLASLTDIIPLEDTRIRGNIDINLDWMGKYSSIENERYDDFKADGSIRIKQLSYKSPDVPDAVKIRKAEIYVSPRNVGISSFDAVMGSSDFEMSGNLTNYIGWLLRDEVVKGELRLNAKRIDLNELMVSDTEEEGSSPEIEEETEGTPPAVIEVPDNIDFRLNSAIELLKYGKLDITRMRGYIYLRNGKLVMENLSMQALDGSLKLSGEYNTQDIRHPLVDLKVNAEGIDIPQAAEAFEVLGKISPIASNASGKVTLQLGYSSLLTQQMKPVLNSISGKGRLASNRIGIKNASGFEVIGEALKTDALNDMTLRDIDLAFEIQGGRLHVEPFETKMGDATMLIGGEHSFDNTMDYDIDLSIPRSVLGLENPAVNSLYNKASSLGVDIPKSEMVNIAINLSGPLKQPKVKLALKEAAAAGVEELKKEIVEEVKETVKEVVEDKKEELEDEAKKKARAEADKIMKDAERQADNIRKEAKNAADDVRREADRQADQLLKEAKNPIAKKAAEPAARKIRQEGEKKAKLIESEADKKAKLVLDEAQKKADKLLE